MDIQTPQLSFREALRYWIKQIKAWRWTYIFGVIAVAGTNLVEVTVPKLFGINIDTLQKEHKFYPLLLAALFVTFIVQFFCRVVWRRTLALQSFRCASELKRSLWDHARFYPLTVFHKRYTRGELINLATGDVTYAQNAFGFHFVASTDFIFLFALSTAAMLSINVRLTLISLVLFPLIPFLVFFLCEKEQKLYGQAQNSLSKLNDTVDSIVGSAKLMKLRPHAPLWNNQLRNASKHYQAQRSQLLTTEAQFFPATALPPAFSVAFFLFFGIQTYRNGLISIGQLVAFHSYLFMIADPLSELGWLVSDWQKAFTSVQRLLAVFAEPRDMIFSAKEPARDLAVPLAVRNLSFSFDQRHLLLDIPSLQLLPRERLGISGNVGSGKSTLGRIISGLDSSYAGEVKVYGTDVKYFVNDELRNRVALVDQNPFLFGATIRENLSLNRTIDDDELWRWLEVVDLVEDFRKFPDGLASHLGEWGINLSGGQRQRLTLARALCRQPDLLVLDDALSAVDVVTEAKIISRLEASLKDLSVILISHRPSSLALCHRQFHLDTHAPFPGGAHV